MALDHEPRTVCRQVAEVIRIKRKKDKIGYLGILGILGVFPHILWGLMHIDVIFEGF